MWMVSANTQPIPSLPIGDRRDEVERNHHARPEFVTAGFGRALDGLSAR
jgi:hypothetical protein